MKLISYSSISYMPVRGGKPFGKYTMSLKLYRRAGATGIRYYYQNIYATSPDTLEKFAKKLLPRAEVPASYRGIIMDSPVMA